MKDHQYFFFKNGESGELMVFYRNHPSLCVPERNFLINVEDFDETEIIRMMLNGRELSDKRKEQFKKFLNESPEVFCFERNFPLYIGTPLDMNYIFKGDNILKVILSWKADILGNVYIYERINRSLGTEERPTVLTKSERKLFIKLMEMKLKHEIPVLRFDEEDEYETEINLKHLGIPIAKEETRVIWENQFFRHLLKRFTKTDLEADAFLIYMKMALNSLYKDKDMKVYCEEKDRYFLGSLLVIPNKEKLTERMRKNLNFYLPMISPDAYQGYIKSKTSIILLNRQETILLLMLCEKIENNLIIIHRNSFKFFDFALTNFIHTLYERLNKDKTKLQKKGGERC